jgi:transposase
MDCQDVEFSSKKSQERIDKALTIFDLAVLNRILTLGLHLMGATRKDIARLLNRSEESVKTSIRVLLRDGFTALRDRRHSMTQPVSNIPANKFSVSMRREGQWQVINLGVPGNELRVPIKHKTQLRTVLLSFFNSRMLSVKQAATAMGISQAHCRELANQLKEVDVDNSLIDKRQGQTQDYRMGPAEKAELIRQFSARSVLKLSTSSEILTEKINEQTDTTVSSRTIRWHMKKLGLKTIRKTLPELVDNQKKTLNKTP